MAESPCHLFWGILSSSTKGSNHGPEGPFLADGMVSGTTRKQHVLAEGKGLFMGEEISELSVC